MCFSLVCRDRTLDLESANKQVRCSFISGHCLLTHLIHSHNRCATNGSLRAAKHPLFWASIGHSFCQELSVLVALRPVLPLGLSLLAPALLHRVRLCAAV